MLHTLALHYDGTTWLLEMVFIGYGLHAALWKS